MRRAIAAAAMTLLPSTATADDPPDETIVIIGLRLPRPILDTPSTVTVVERDEIERSPRSLPDELVRTVPSAATFRRSSSLIADPTSQGPNLRGVGPSAVSRALVLRDGIPASDPFGGWMYWRGIPLLSIERFEVAPGGSSALFGDMALGGVVDVVSRPIEPQTVEALVAGGSLETGRGAVHATDRHGALGVALDGEVFHSGGYTPIVASQRGPIDGPASSDHRTAGIRVERRVERSLAHLSATWFDEHLDAGTAFTTADVRVVDLAAGWRLERAAGTLQLGLFGGVRSFRQTRARVAPDRSTASLANAQHTPSDGAGALATWTATDGAHTWLVGTDVRRVAGTATDALSPPMVSDDSLVERSAGGEQFVGGVFAQDVWSLTDALDLAAALRLDSWHARAGQRHSHFGDGSEMTARFVDRDELQLDPRIGALYRATDAVALRASVYRSFRAPTLNELYRPFQVGTILTEANPDLRPETLWGAEAGPQIVAGGMIFRATGFYNRLDDAVANVTLAEPLPSGATRQRQNLGRSRVAGLELDLSWRPTASWLFLVAHTFTDARVVAAPAQPELVGKRLAQDPRDRTVASATFDDARWLTATAQLRHLGRQFEDDLETLPMDAVTLLDARVDRRLARGVAIFASVQNLFDRHYLVGRAGVDTEGAPRMFELGLTYR